MHRENEARQIGELVKTTKSAGFAANNPTRHYTKPHQPKYVIPPVARFKCKVWFLDGNKKCFYSYDTKQSTYGTMIRDEWEGLLKLMRMIEKWRKDGVVKTAMIWANLDDVPLSAGKYDYEVHKTTRFNSNTEELNFLPAGTDSILDLNRVKYRIAKTWEQQRMVVNG